MCRASDAVQLLIQRLRNESDTSVIQATLAATSLASSPPLTALANTNRAAAASFARSAGKLSALMMLQLQQKPIMDQGDLCNEASLAKRQQMETSMGNALLRDPGPFEGTTQLNPTFFAWRLLYTVPFNNLFAKAQRDTLEGNSGILVHRNTPSDQSVAESLDQFRQTARFLQATSAALEQALRARSGQTYGVDLAGIALVSGDVANTNLSRTRFDGAYLAMLANNTDFRGASFAGANMAFMKVDGPTNFDGAVLHDALVPAAWRDNNDVLISWHAFSSQSKIRGPVLLPQKRCLAPPTCPEECGTP